MCDHPDFPFLLLSIDEVLENEDAVIRGFVDQALPGFSVVELPEDVHGPWDSDRIAAIVDAVLEIAAGRALPFVQAIEAIVDSALAFPDVRAAFDAGDSETAWSLATLHGLTADACRTVIENHGVTRDACLAVARAMYADRPNKATVPAS